MLIGRALQTVLNDENISRVLDAANDPQRYDEGGEHRLTKTGPAGSSGKTQERFVMACQQDCGEQGLPMQIGSTQIQVHAEKAVVCYSVPLPEDSPLAGTRRQKVDLPEEVLA